MEVYSLHVRMNGVMSIIGVFDTQEYAESVLRFIIRGEYDVQVDADTAQWLYTRAGRPNRTGLADAVIQRHTINSPVFAHVEQACWIMSDDEGDGVGG